MASLSPKGTDLKKSPPKVLSPSNGTADKTSVTKSPLKSPPSKLTTKSPILKSNDTGKVNLTKSKMDSSPPKVARSPSSKSITPPGKSPSKSPLSKPALDKSNSQGDIVVSSALKSAVTGIVPLDNEVTNTAEAKQPEPARESETPAVESNTESESKPDEAAAANGATSSAPLINGDSAASDSIPAKVEQTLDQQQIAMSEQRHASGDGAAASNEKVENIESAGESGHASETKASEKSTDNETSTQHLPSSGVTLTVIKKESPTDDTTDSGPTTGSEDKPESKDEAKQDKPDNESIKKDDASTPKPSPNTTTSECANSSTETVETAKLTDEPESTVPEVSKQFYRLKVWDQLEKNDLVLFPRPCNGRIPNFKGAHQAAEKLIGTKVFKNCKTIKVNPDKAQEMVRFHTLEHGKRLLVPVPRLREGLCHAIVPPFDASKYQLQQASQRYGMKKWGKSVGVDDKVTIDMVVLGSVAVDKKGRRIGKGEGYADLDFAMLAKMNAITDNTVVVTTVHDDQIFDELPEEIFKEYDVPVDWIVTPTQIIQIAEPLEKPKNVIWSILSNRRIMEIPILQKLREQEISEGSECTLKEVDSDVEEKPYPVQESVFKKRFQQRRRRYNNYSRSTGDPIRDSKLAAGGLPAPHGAPDSMPFYNNRQRRYSPNQNRMRDYNDGGRRYDAPAQQPMRRNNYYQPPPPQSYGGMKHQQQQQYNNRPPMRQDGQNRNMRRNGPPGQVMNGPMNMNHRSAQNAPRMGRQRGDNRPPNTTMTKSVEVQTIDKNRASRPFVKRKRAPIEFSLRVKNIGNGVRVRDLKTALNERGIKPRDITWRGYRGFAFLHFVKSAASKENQPLAVEDVIHALEGLPLPPKNKKNLVIEPAKPKNSSSESSGGVEEPIGKTTITLESAAAAVSTELPIFKAALLPNTNQPIAV